MRRKVLVVEDAVEEGEEEELGLEDATSAGNVPLRVRQRVLVDFFRLSALSIFFLTFQLKKEREEEKEEEEVE